MSLRKESCDWHRDRPSRSKRVPRNRLFHCSLSFEILEERTLLSVLASDVPTALIGPVSPALVAGRQSQPALGNRGASVAPQVTPPTITSVVAAEATPQNGILESNEKLVITWAATSTLGIASQTMTVDGKTISPINDPYGGLNYSCPIGIWSTGSHTYAITATDSTGVSSNSTGTFVVVAQPATPIPRTGDYYVAVDGNDASDGAIDAPFKTFQKALSAAVAGDTIYVRGGTYTKDNAMVYSITWASTTDEAHESEQMSNGTWHYVYRCFIAIQDRAKADWWDPYPAYTVNSGTAEAPVTIKNYPGETPVLDCSGFTIYGAGSMVLPKAVNIDSKCYWVIDGLEMEGGIINISGGGSNKSSTNTHDITIENCNIHNVTVAGGNNPGLIRIDRADTSGGAYNIFIYNNKLHDLSDWGCDWATTTDFAHFGAFTELSVEQIVGYSAGPGTRDITISGNEIYDCPQAFFFKKITPGPFLVQGNIIHDCQTLGVLCASNVSFIHNIVYDVPLGFWYVGSDLDYRPGDYNVDQAIAGNYETIEYNTFVGLNQLMSIWQGHSHTIMHNIIFGLTGITAGAGWDTPSYLQKSYDSQDASLTDTMTSLLYMPTNITSDYNGFISPNVTDFQMAERQFPSPSFAVEHYNYSEALTAFGLDPDSVFVQQSDATRIFTDPADHDYTLKNPSQFPGMGYYAYGISPPTVSIVAVTPDLRVTPVGSITIQFSEPVVGFDLGDLQLTLDGVSVPLNGATLTTSDQQNWTLGNLSVTTSPVGGYQLTLVAAGLGITGFAGNPLTVGANATWRTVPPIPGDFNLDGVVDNLDVAIWFANAFTGTTWQQVSANEPPALRVVVS